MNVLVLNAGSSTLKFALWRMESGSETLLRHEVIEHTGDAVERAAEAAIQKVQASSDTLDAVGVRVVHGGKQFTTATRTLPEVVGAIRELAKFAPLHNPADAAIIEAAARLLPKLPVYAVFDTAFHATLPPFAFTYALPSDLTESHSLRRYGFHGISHRYVSQCLLTCLEREAAGSRLITAHLGNGSSVCAIRDGQSVDTSMGLTPLEGLMMGTRSGDVDAGLVIYLVRSLGMPADAVDDLLNHQSGLIGVSGVSADMREVEQAADSGNARARLALEIFAYRVSKTIGGYAAALGGLDALAFTGGIGEHSASTRARICERLGVLGIRLDAERSGHSGSAEPAQISADSAAVAVWVVPTDEERQIAREVFAALTPVPTAQTSSGGASVPM